jgi:hypothetical protein
MSGEVSSTLKVLMQIRDEQAAMRASESQRSSVAWADAGGHSAATTLRSGH